jgi:hypothetical protein
LFNLDWSISMSSILLSNPFITVAPPPSGPQETAVSALAVAPTSGPSTGSSAGNSTSFSGSGSGYSGGSEQQAAVALIRDRAKAVLTRPADATGKSVVNAQTQNGTQPQIGAEITPFGVNLPKVEMPDPLPTSPFLASMSVKD